MEAVCDFGDGGYVCVWVVVMVVDDFGGGGL